MKMLTLGLVLLLLNEGASAQLPVPVQAPPEETEAEEAPPTPVEAKVDLTKDRAIEERLEATYGLLARFAHVRVNVRAGVVELSGTVANPEARGDAEALAKQVQGVVAVSNGIEVERNLRRRLRAVTEELRSIAYDVIAYLPLLGAAILVVVLFWGLGYVITRWDWIFCKASANVFVQDVLRRVVRLGLLTVGVVLALRVLNAVALVSAILGAAGLVGLVLGLGFRDLAENYISGILLSLRQPFLPHDLVIIEGYEGKIIRLTSRATVIMTYDGNHVRIPNSTVFKGIVRNLTRNPARRFDFTVGVSYDTDLTRARDIGIEAIRAMDSVLADPPPDAWLDAFGDWSITIHYFGWINSHDTNYFKAKGEAIRIVKEALDAAGVCIPVPLYDLNIARRPAESEKETPPALGPPPHVETDLAADSHLDRQVSEERAASAQPDLLDPSEPRKD